MDDKVLKNKRCEVLELNSELKSKLNTIQCQTNNDRQFFPANFLHVFKLNHNFLIHLQKNMQHLRKSQYLLLLLSLSFSLSHYNLYHHHELDFNHNLSFFFFFLEKKAPGPSNVTSIKRCYYVHLTFWTPDERNPIKPQRKRTSFLKRTKDLI